MGPFGGRIRLHGNVAKLVETRSAIPCSGLSRLRDECLNETLFNSLGHARAVLAA